MWGPRSIAKLVNVTPITMVYDTYNYSIQGAYKPTSSRIGCWSRANFKKKTSGHLVSGGSWWIHIRQPWG